MKRFLRKIKSTTLLVWLGVFAMIPGIGKKPRQRASHIHFRHEPVKFFGLHEFSGLSLLFLTDPHIGWSIDAIAAQTAHGIQMLLANAKPETTIVLHGGDFVSAHGTKKTLSFEHFVEVAKKLFHGLEGFRHFAVVGNHDDDNADFVHTRAWLEDKMQVHFLTEVRHAKKIFINDKSLCIHGIHTLAKHLHKMPKKERNIILDQYIYTLNHMHNDLNVVLLHNPDGLEFLLARLKSTKQSITTPTLFLAGHTHGAMVDLPFLRKIGLLASRTAFTRYKWWYWPEGKYSETGNWKLYVSTGMGNSPGFDFRMNADPEVVLFTL